MSKILGKNVTALFFDNSMWKTYACARSITLDVETSFIVTSVSGSGSWQTVLPTINSFTATIDGISNLDLVNTLSLADLRSKQYNRERLQVRYEREDLDGNIYTDAFYCYIAKSSDSNPFDNISVFNIELKGDGAITQIYTPTPQNPYSRMNRIEYTGVGGEASATLAATIDKSIVSVVKDGLGQCTIKTSGLPANKEVVYDATTGTFTFAIEFETGEQMYVLYQDL